MSGRAGVIEEIEAGETGTQQFLVVCTYDDGQQVVSKKMAGYDSVEAAITDGESLDQNAFPDVIILDTETRAVLETIRGSIGTELQSWLDQHYPYPG